MSAYSARSNSASSLSRQTWSQRPKIGCSGLSEIKAAQSDVLLLLNKKCLVNSPDGAGLVASKRLFFLIWRVFMTNSKLLDSQDSHDSTSLHTLVSTCACFDCQDPSWAGKSPWTVPLRPPFVPKTSSAALIVASIVPRLRTVIFSAYDHRIQLPLCPTEDYRFLDLLLPRLQIEDGLLEPGEGEAGVAGFSHGVWPISCNNPCQLLLQISSVLCQWSSVVDVKRWCFVG